MSDVVEAIRVAGQQRQREYEASIARGERPQLVEERILGKLDVIPAREIFDRDAIEERAVRLIDSFTPEAKQLRPLEAEANARTAIFEALTASGHMSRVELPGKQDEVHAQVIERLLNGFYRPGIPEHERARVFQEICEELTIQEAYMQIIIGHLPPETKVTTVSDFTLGPDADKLGYRSKNKKGMIRETSFELGEEGNYTRVIKQISRSNSDATTTIEVLQKSGVTINQQAKADIDLLGSQLVSAKIGALEIMKLLDHHAGMAVMYGDYKQQDSIGYEWIEQESMIRESRIESFIDELAGTEKMLDELFRRGEIDQTTWSRRYGEKLRRVVQSICVINPSYVRDALGDRVAEEYERAHQVFMSGDSSGAADIISGVSHMESSIIICGMEIRSEATDNSKDAVRADIEKMLERSKWDWPDGYCVVDRCEFKNKLTKVGPCEVCMRCQGIYDAGKNPSDVYRRQQEITALEDAYSLSYPVEETKQVANIEDTLEVVETKMVFGGAIKIYRDGTTGMVGTKNELLGVS